MYLDNSLLLMGSISNGVLTPATLTTATGTYYSANVYDTAPATVNTPNQPVDLGMGETLEISLAFPTGPTTAAETVNNTPGTLEIQLISDSSAASFGSTTPQILCSTGAIFVPGTWQGTYSYTVGSTVISGGLIYVCIAASTNNTPASSPTYWQLAGTAALQTGTLTYLHVDHASPHLLQRYIGLKYIVGGISLAGGTIVAAIVKSTQDIQNIFYGSGFKVL